MSIAVDGFKILKRMGEAPEAFRAVRADADKAARTMVVKTLKAKTTGVNALHEMHAALRGQFELVMESMTDAEIKNVLTRLDKHHPDLKTMSGPEKRRHLLALATADAEPARPVAKAKKAKKASKTSEPKRLQSAIADIIRERGEEEED